MSVCWRGCVAEASLVEGEPGEIVKHMQLRNPQAACVSRRRPMAASDFGSGKASKVDHRTGCINPGAGALPRGEGSAELKDMKRSQGDKIFPRTRDKGERRGFRQGGYRRDRERSPESTGARESERGSRAKVHLRHVEPPAEKKCRQRCSKGRIHLELKHVYRHARGCQVRAEI